MGVWDFQSLFIPSHVTGSKSYLDAGAEQTVFELAAQSRSFISSILLDLSNMTQNGTIKLYSKIDGTNYRLLSSASYTVGVDPVGVFVDLRINVRRGFKITYTEGGDEGADRAIPFCYLLE